MNKKPDQVVITSGLATESTTPLTSTSANQRWYWDETNRVLSYILHNNAGRTPFIDYNVKFNARKCRWANCQVPTQPALKTPASKRPTTFYYWSNATTWELASITRSAEGGASSVLPIDGDYVTIPSDIWVVVDVALPKLLRLKVEGGLEIDDTIDNKLTVGELFINGGQFVVGWEDKSFTHKFEIELTGTKDSLGLMLPNGFDSMGAKAIGVYGALDLHGIPRSPSWTRLASTASTGSNQITLSEAVDWQVGEEIVVSTTSYNTFDTESFKITAVSADKKTLTLNTTLKANHRVVSETFANSKSYSVAAGVGLLSRNIKITGGVYENQFSELFGSRVIVSDYSTLIYAEGSTTPTTIYYKGNARIENVEFKNFGQYSRNSEDDYKYGILFSNLGNYDNIRRTYLKNCAFNNGFSSAVGVRNSASIPMEGNVFHRSIDSAFRVEGHSNIIRNNLITMTIWGPTFAQGEAAGELKWWGAIDIQFAESAVVENNLIAGAERIGINFRGSPCDGQSLDDPKMNHSIQYNSIYGALVGATIFPDTSFSLTCIRYTNFFVYKSIYTGLYYQSKGDVVFDSNTLVDNQLSIFPQVFSPSSTSHVFKARSILIKNNLLVGTSASFDCTNDVKPNTFVISKSSKAEIYGSGANGKGRIGLVWSNFVDGSNTAPRKPFYNIMTYNYINGLATMDGNTFAHFKTSCGNVDAVITSSKNNEDGQMPVLFKNTVLYDVDTNSKVFLHRPEIGKINPSDCVDMDCDGNKKNLLTDSDGSFLGSPGTVISQSEFGWNEQSRGIGDYRVPKEVLVDSNGNQRSPSSVYSYPGIVRDQSLCQYRDSWQGYECHGLDYRMLVIESMDVDTESRRISPVAILSDNKYIDLINGPQDHGWCFGYTCQRRISTFLALVAANKHYDIFLSATPPSQLRFRIINADSTFKTTLSMTYSTSNNIDVYKNVNLVDPTNADRTSGSLMLKDGSLSTYKPKLTDPPGTNYVYRPEKKVFFSIDGSDYIDLVISADIFITFGVRATTADAFFNSANLVANIATLLNIPASMIRRVEIVSETGSSSRLVKRQGSSSTITSFTVQVTDNPPADISGVSSAKQAIQVYAASISADAQLGTLTAKAAAAGVTMTSTTLQIGTTTTDLKVIGSFKLIQDVKKCRAQSPCETQPIIQLFDTNGAAITVLQSGNPFSVLATVTTGTNTIVRESTLAFDANGKAIFKSFSLGSEGTGFKVTFELIASNGATVPSTLRDTTSSFNVDEPKFNFVQVESDSEVEVGKLFNANFYLVDDVSKVEMPNPGYKGQTFQACISLYQTQKWSLSNAAINISSNCVSLNAANRFVFSNMSINVKGAHIFKLSITSNDNKVSVTDKSSVITSVLSTSLIQSTTKSGYQYNLLSTFNGVYKEYDRVDYIATFVNFLMQNGGFEVISPFDCRSGSVIVNLIVIPLSATENTALNVTLQASVNSILPGMQLISLSLFDQTVITKAAESSSSVSSSFSVVGVVVGTIAGVGCIGLIVFGSVLIYRHQKAKKQGQSTENETTRKITSGKRLLTDDHDVYENESVTVKRPNSVVAMSRLQEMKTPEAFFTNREASMSAVQVEKI